MVEINMQHSFICEGKYPSDTK